MGKPLPLRIRRIEDKEKKGAHGQWRREFCKKYSAQLSKGRDKAWRSLLESLSAKGEAISCKKGCTYCCYHYVTVSLAHGILIVDYLYKRKELLKRFLDNYEQWREAAESIPDSIDRIRLHSLSTGMPIEAVITETRPLSNRYFHCNIPCPFLLDGSCSIYEVRPPSCADHHAVSPPEYCAPASKQEPEIRRSVTEDEDVIALAQLADARLSLFELTLPTMVYRLLTEGSAAMLTEIINSSGSAPYNVKGF